jgi:hypothetical protein
MSEIFFPQFAQNIASSLNRCYLWTLMAPESLRCQDPSYISLGENGSIFFKIFPVSISLRIGNAVTKLSGTDWAVLVFLPHSAVENNGQYVGSVDIHLSHRKGGGI